MRRVLQFTFFFAFLLFISCGSNSNTVVEKTFHVWGNNEICKHNIEQACKLNGVSDANWNQDSKLLKFIPAPVLKISFIFQNNFTIQRLI